MALDGRLGDVELGGYLSVTESAGGEQHYLGLPLREPPTGPCPSRSSRRRGTETTTLAAPAFRLRASMVAISSSAEKALAEG